MPSRKSGALSEFHRSTHRVTSSQSFLEKFDSYCRDSDRHGMIKVLMDIEQVMMLKIEESYENKNDKEAEKIFEIYLSLRNEKDQRISNFLTRALFAATPSSSIFNKILIERARFWYSVGHTARCLKDCDYLISALNENPLASSADYSEDIKETNALCAELRSKCIETLERSNKTWPNKLFPNGNSVVALPRVDSSSEKNSKMPSCSDSLSLCHDETRGRHLVAARNIKVGSVVMIDKPFSFSTDFEALPTNCLHCHVSLGLDTNVRIPCHNCQTVSFCSNDCRLDSWRNYHKYECKILNYFYETNVRDIDLAQQRRSHLLLAWRTTIQSFRNNTKSEDSLECPEDEFAEMEEHRINSCIDPYDPLDYPTVFALETHCPEAPVTVNLSRSLRSIFFAKCFHLVYYRSSFVADVTKLLFLFAVRMLRHMQSINCNAYEIVENTRDPETKIWQPRNVGGAIYPTVSLINHACYPNIVRHSYPNGRVVVRALRFIAKGEEILDCYGPHFVSDSLSHRRRYLQDKYHFICNCEACAKDFQLSDESSALTIKCSKCNSPITQGLGQCPKCKTSIDFAKKQVLLAKSVKKRAAAIAKMFNGNYLEALPILLEHAALLEKQLVDRPSLEIIKTQQSIIQCYNSLSCVASLS